MRRYVALSLLSALLSVIGCERPATQIVVRVDSDMREGDELRAVRITMRRSGTERDVYDQTVDLTAGTHHLPGTVGVVPGDPEDSRRLEVTAEAILAAGEAFSTRAVVSFQPGQTLLLDLYLASRCRDPANRAGCGPDETCGPNGCEPVTRAMLPGYSPDAARLDVPALEEDAAVDDLVDDLVEPDVVDVVEDAGEDVPCGPGRTCCDAGVTCADATVCTVEGACAPCGAGRSCCDDGTVCGDAGVCAPGDDGGAGRCVACGGAGQACCEGEACAGGAMCAMGTCASCGGRDEPCCGMGVCAAGLSCAGGRCQCGGVGQPCCPTGMGGINGACAAGAACVMGACAPCGATGQACCAGDACGASSVCSGGRCVACGASGQPCCEGNACGASLTCAGGRCACGASGQPCCGGASCGGGLVCSGGRCAACGGAGQLCCAGGACGGGTVCSGGRCATCGGNGQPCCAGGACDPTGSACVATACAAGVCRHSVRGDGASAGAQPSLRCCGGVAVDISTNPNHCGGCGMRCGSGSCEPLQAIPCGGGAGVSGRCRCNGANAQCPTGRSSQQICRGPSPYNNRCAPENVADCAPGATFFDISNCPNYCRY